VLRRSPFNIGWREGEGRDFSRKLEAHLGGEIRNVKAGEKGRNWGNKVIKKSNEMIQNDVLDKKYWINIR